MKQPENKPRPIIKKVKKHAAHHGGSWKVAYADFVTAMMALFLVLWLVSQADIKVKQAIANYFRAPGVFDTIKGGVIDGPKKVSKEPSTLTSKDEEQALLSTAALLKKNFSTRPEFGKYKDQIQIDVTDQGLRIQILDKADHVSFPSGSAEVSADALPILSEIAQAICQLPNPILIGGHTDRRLFPAGSTYTNWELSADRANAARRILEADCVRPESIRRIVGYADTELLVPDDPFAPSNRRISITVMRMSGPETAATTENQPQNLQGPKDAVSSTANERKDSRPATAPSNHEDSTKGKGTPAVNNVHSEKLATEGVVRGNPDKLPEGVPRLREVRPSTAPTPED